MLKLAGETDIGILEAHEDSLSPHRVETLPVLLEGGNLLHIPTLAGWTASNAGSGMALQYLSSLELRTGTTASSRGLLNTNCRGFNLTNTIASRLDWSKKLYFVFNVSRVGDDSEVYGRVQIKEVTTEGQLAAKGVGIEIQNYAVHGESYGTARATVDLSTALANNKAYQIVIEHGLGSHVKWYVNGALVGTQSTAANIPSGAAGTTSSVVASLVNGVTGGVACFMEVYHPKIWQER